MPPRTSTAPWPRDPSGSKTADSGVVARRRGVHRSCGELRSSLTHFSTRAYPAERRPTLCCKEMIALPRNAQIWLPGYLKTLLRWRRPVRHVWVMIGDFYEPLWERPPVEVGLERVRRWQKEWPQIAERHRDSGGRPPRYTFFYAEEEYRPEFVDPLAEMTALGIGDVEIHLPHDAEPEGRFVARISRFKETLSVRHGLLRRAGGKLVFGFIHGNWALDNSLPGGRAG